MMTKKEIVFTFLKNVLIYSAIFIGTYYLYNSDNSNKYNIPHTDFSFVYAQF